jgi:hypothetical protein
VITWWQIGLGVIVMKHRALIAVGYVVTVIAVILVGHLVFVLQRAAPTVYSIPITLPTAADLMNGVDKSVGMMFSLTLGLFVLAGFVLRGMERPQRMALFSLAVSAGFLATSVFSIYMGFMARNVALYYASFPSELSISASGTFIVLQALGVAGSALCSFLLLGDFFLSATSASQKAGTKAPQ